MIKFISIATCIILLYLLLSGKCYASPELTNKESPCIAKCFTLRNLEQDVPIKGYQGAAG